MSRHITKRFYAYAYCTDYSDVALNNIKIDSSENMIIIQKKVYDMMSNTVNTKIQQEQIEI